MAMPLFEKAVRYSRGTNPSEFHQTLENKATEVVFAGLEEGHLALFVRGFVADATGKVAAERYDNVDTVDSAIGYFLGLNDHIKEHMRTHNTWEKMGYRRAAYKFVQMEVEAHPDAAGSPIAEVEIDVRGRVRWVSRGACRFRVGPRGGSR